MNQVAVKPAVIFHEVPG